jgi:mono/diheme cytochrome c family protein
MRSIAAWSWCVALLVSTMATVSAVAQQQARQPAAQAQPAEPAKDYNQRALEIYEFRKAAQSGPTRGQEIYYYKCWMCHNELAEGGAPKLVGLFKRTTLVTGEPLNDETVKNQIRNGSANMGAYKYALSDADLNDLVSWLHDEKCCWNSDAPPLNPRYKGDAAGPAEQVYAALTGGPKGLVKNARGEPIALASFWRPCLTRLAASSQSETVCRGFWSNAFWAAIAASSYRRSIKYVKASRA